ncbi:putative oxidoreductase [Rubidibacter lacunae KORDI 51-2]|uniref:Putative oxidoreductase n=1 Tax=Rubidibacter lacunae KORDI 51-2 TaxID=582515 RepID=U5DPX6_9CHRO|nr:aldo/keto reductase [Rubidibacter lacunae]ERN42654.1 putative oxidoreductase [Rubidibacter lacunae KORDI 51-2]
METIEQLPLGNNGPLVGRIGYGAMVLEGYYGASDDESAVRTLVQAIDRGMMIDSADAYGAGHNELLIARAVKVANNEPFVATKFGIVFDENESGTELPTGWGFSLKINGTPEYVEKALDASLERLGVDTIDLWYAHYLDPAVPVEETVGTMSRAVESGKVRYLGLSNVSEAEIRRANLVHPINAVQYEYSLWRREAETDLLPTLRELGISLVGWSPLGGGFLTGTVRSLDEGDFRNNNPRYSSENLKANQERFSPLMDIANELDISPAQLALAWLLHQGQDVFPIPGSRKQERLEENAAAIDIHLDRNILDKINEIASPGATSGATLV